MKKQQTTNNKNLLTKLIMLVLFLTLVNCQKEESQNDPKISQELTEQQLQVTMTNWSHFSEQSKKASQNISKLQKTPEQARSTESDIYDFTLDTSRVQIIQQQGFRTYAFYIMRPELNSNKVENYVYKEYENGDYAQYLLAYDCEINDEGVTVHDAESLLITPIDDSGLLSRSGCEVQLTDTYDEVSCEYRVYCTGIGHEIGDDCPCGTSGYLWCKPPGMTCYSVPISVWTEICPGGNPDPIDPDPTNPGGGTGGTVTFTYGEPTVSYPVQHPAFYNIIECINGTGFIDLNDTTTIDPTLMFGLNADWKAMSIYLNQDNNCSEEAQAVIILEILLETNPLLILEIDCNQIQHWQALAQNEASQEIINKINNLPSTFFNDFEIQSLEEANGTVVNMDYFPVNITTLPINPTTGQPFSADGFLDYFRRNINYFTDGGGTTFEPYCENVSPSICQQETDLWNSNDPTGALVYLDIISDDGVVICSEFHNDYWYFMTMNAPYAGNHPVSGTRQFGYEINSDGSYNFFVRGVDRFNSFIQSDIAQALSNTDPFLAADVMWYAFQANMNNYVNTNGGVSTIGTTSTNRPNWNKVRDVLLGVRPISDLGCN